MLIRVDPGSPLPLGEQVAASVRRALAEGTLTAGQRLPAARELAHVLGVNLHTVLRGYRLLRDEGLIELRRGRGAVVTGSGGAGLARLAERARELVSQARTLGMGDEEVMALLRQALDTPGGPGSAGRPPVVDDH